MPNSVAKHLAKPVLSWGRNAVPGILIFHFPLADSWALTNRDFSPQRAKSKWGREDFSSMLFFFFLFKFMNKSFLCLLMFRTLEVGDDFFSVGLHVQFGRVQILCHWSVQVLTAFVFVRWSLSHFPVTGRTILSASYLLVLPYKLSLFLSRSVWEHQNKNDFVAVL